MFGRRAFPLRSLRSRLATSYAGLALLSVLVSAIYTGTVLRNVMFSRIAVDLSDETRLVADRIADPLAAGDLQLVQAELSRVDALTGARFAVVDQDEHTVGTTASAPGIAEGDEALALALRGESTMASGFGFGNEVVQITVPLRAKSGAIVGALRASYHVEDIQDVITRVNANTLLGAVGAALIAAILGLVFAATVSRPIQRVAEAVHHLAAGRRAPYIADSRGNVTEVRDLTEAYRSLTQQLVTHEQARTEFASDVSHELRSLASAMQTAAEALERWAASNASLAPQLVAGLVGHTRRLNRLSDDLLELARWEGGRMRLTLQPLDIGEVVRSTASEWRAEADEHGVRLIVDAPPEPTTVMGDRDRLGQTLGNLVENALKYARSGGQIRIELSVQRPSRTCTVAVTDSGPGIPDDVLPRVFDRYFRVEGRAGEGPGGMGLGLAIAREIALAHGGDLLAESPPEGGARFVLHLPTAESQAEGTAVVAQAVV